MYLIMWEVINFEDFTLCEMVEMDLILEDNFVETHIVGARHKLVCL